MSVWPLLFLGFFELSARTNQYLSA